MCAHNTHNTALSSGSEGWPWTRNVIFVNVTMARERTQAWLALLPPPVPGSHSHSFPQPHCASLGAGQDCHPESTKQHGVLHHILAGDVKALGSRHTAELLLVGGRMSHTLPGRAWAAAMLESWLQHHSWQGSAGRCWHRFISSAQSLEETMSRCHPLCPAMGGGGARLPWKVSRSQTAFHAGHSQAEPRGSHRSLAAQEVVQHPPTATAQGFPLCCRHWDELGKGKGRNRSRRAWRAGVGAE